MKSLASSSTLGQSDPKPAIKKDKASPVHYVVVKSIRDMYHYTLQEVACLTKRDDCDQCTDSSFHEPIERCLSLLYMWAQGLDFDFLQISVHPSTGLQEIIVGELGAIVGIVDAFFDKRRSQHTIKRGDVASFVNTYIGGEFDTNDDMGSGAASPSDSESDSLPESRRPRSSHLNHACQLKRLKMHVECLMDLLPTIKHCYTEKRVDLDSNEDNRRRVSTQYRGQEAQSDNDIGSNLPVESGNVHGDSDIGSISGDEGHTAPNVLEHSRDLDTVSSLPNSASSDKKQPAVDFTERNVSTDYHGEESETRIRRSLELARASVMARSKESSLRPIDHTASMFLPHTFSDLTSFSSQHRTELSNHHTSGPGVRPEADDDSDGSINKNDDHDDSGNGLLEKTKAQMVPLHRKSTPDITNRCLRCRLRRTRCTGGWPCRECQRAGAADKCNMADANKLPNVDVHERYVAPDIRENVKKHRKSIKPAQQQEHKLQAKHSLSFSQDESTHSSETTHTFAAAHNDSNPRKQAAPTVRDKLLNFGRECVARHHAHGAGLTYGSAPQFAADVLLHTCQRYHQDQADDTAIMPNQETFPGRKSSTTRTRILTLADMRYVSESCVKPFTESIRRSLFLCSACDIQERFFSFEVLIQHYAAKHTKAFSRGNSIVHWGSEWPAHPPFDPHPRIGTTDVAASRASSSKPRDEIKPSVQSLPRSPSWSPDLKARGWGESG